MEEDPGWSATFANAEEAVPFVAKAVSAWSGVSTANINWRIGGVVPLTGPMFDEHDFRGRLSRSGL